MLPRMAVPSQAEEQAEEQAANEGRAAEVALQVERIDINETGFMALKKLLIERGVPEAEVKVPNKFMLKEVAAKYKETCLVEFV